MENLAELIGVIIGDGNICFLPHTGSYYVEITGNPKTENNYYKYLSKLFVKVVGKSGTISLRGRGLRIRVYSKEFVEFLIKDLGMHYGEGKFFKVVIPQKIFDEGEKMVAKCIRGIFDTDGTFFISKKEGKLYPSIEIVTSSRILAIQIYDILLKNFRVNMRWRNSENYTKGRVYVIGLYGVNETKKWFRIIGSSNPSKFEKYANFIKNLK